MIYKIAGSNFSSLILGILGILLIPKGLFTDVIAWNAAFVNYVPPMVTALFFIWTNMEKHRDTFSFSVFMGIVMLCGQLFLESMTVYQLLLVACTVVCQKVFTRERIAKYNYFALTGTLIGTFLMIINPSYYMISNSSYRQTTHGIIQIINNYIFQTHFYFLTFNGLLNALIAALFILILLCKSRVRLRKIIITILSGYLAYFVFINTYVNYKSVTPLFVINNLSVHIAYLDTFVMTSFWFLIILLTLYLLPIKLKVMVILFQISGGITAGPYLIVASPLRIREYFGNYIFMLLVALLIADYAIQLVLKGIKFDFSKFKFFSALLVSLLALNLIFVMSINHHVNTIRTNDVTWLNSNKALTKHVPFRNHVKNLDMLNAQFKFYYKDRHDMTFVQRLLH